jgi:hypothetical protein
LIEIVFPSKIEKEMPLHHRFKGDIGVYIIEEAFLIKDGKKR